MTQGDSVRTAADVLRAARELISTPEKWTKGCMGRNGKGRVLMSTELDHAVCYCATGAILAVDHQGFRAMEFLERAIPAKGAIGYWNDRQARTHAEVLAAFDKAIALAEQEQS